MKSATVLATGGLGPNLRIVIRAWMSRSNLIGTNKRRLYILLFWSSCNDQLKYFLKDQGFQMPRIQILDVMDIKSMVFI